MSDPAQPHRQQPTRLRRPWDSPGKNTGVGCHFLLQCMKVKSQSEVAQSCPTLSDPMDCSTPGSSVHGIFQTRVLEWGTIASSYCPLFLFSLKLLERPFFSGRSPLALTFQSTAIVFVPTTSLKLLSLTDSLVAKSSWPLKYP